MTHLLLTPDLDKPTRLDRVLRMYYPEWGRQAVQRLIAGRKVTVNGRSVWLASWEIRSGDRIELAETPVAKASLFAHFDDAWLLAETPEWIAVNKPAGLLSELTRWGQGVNLRDLAVARFGPLVLFHRLDRDTSGVMILSRPGPFNQYLDYVFKARMIEKEYLAVVRLPNQLLPEGEIDARLAPDPHRRDKMVVVARGGQSAHTRYAIADKVDGLQLVRLWPTTGRTHQLRVHLAHLGAPILGDRLYGPKATGDPRLLLHAQRLDLPSAQGYPARTLTAPLPDGFWPPTSAT
jgi:23S rRNA pseudouridine1911/1915/1917 synthase